MSVRLCRSTSYQFQQVPENKTNCTTTDGNDKVKTCQDLFSAMSISDVFQRLPSSTQSVLKRSTVSFILICGFLLLLYGGPPCLVIITLLAQIQCWKEVTVIALKQQAITGRHNTNYFFLCALLYFWCDNLFIYYHPYVTTSILAQFVESYYKFICFCLYFVGVIWFVMNLQRKHYRKQFGLLAWTHVMALVIVAPSCLITKTIYQGMIWFIICVTTITSNDIMAYICGKLFGKTPLIAVSPKKTWEGFIGAGIFTIIISCAVSYSLLDKEYYICPVEYEEVKGEIVRVEHCVPDTIFQLSVYHFFEYPIELYPIVVHTFWLSIFGSVIAPFGGFFASGFKRACNIKDFGASIPGHGGVMDRFDCQLVMIVFLHVYIGTFVSRPQDERNITQKLFQRIMNMTTAQQVEMYYLLENNITV